MAADSQIRIWKTSDDYITLDYAQSRVHYAEQGERIRDRLGLVHRIAPGVARYPIALTLSILAEELTRMNASGASTPRSVLEWLEYYFRGQAMLVVYLKGETLAMDGSDLTRDLAYKAYIEDLPQEFFGTLPIVGSGPEMVELPMLVTDDGTFSNFDSLESYVEFTPLRP